jgi:hypothetical protein
MTRERAKEIAEASRNIPNGLGLMSITGLRLFRREPFLAIPALHDYLTDAADWDAATWDFEVEGRERLVCTLRWLYERMPERFQFSVMWGPDRIDHRDVDRLELLGVIEANAISTTTVYNVRSA